MKELDKAKKQLYIHLGIWCSLVLGCAIPVQFIKNIFGIGVFVVTVLMIRTITKVVEAWDKDIEDIVKQGDKYLVERYDGRVRCRLIRETKDTGNKKEETFYEIAGDIAGVQINCKAKSVYDEESRYDDKYEHFNTVKHIYFEGYHLKLKDDRFRDVDKVLIYTENMKDLAEYSKGLEVKKEQKTRRQNKRGQGQNKREQGYTVYGTYDITTEQIEDIEDIYRSLKRSIKDEETNFCIIVKRGDVEVFIRGEVERLLEVIRILEDFICGKV